MFKKSISILLAFILLFGVLGIVPISASAQEVDVAEDGAEIKVADTGITLYWPVYGHTSLSRGYGGGHNGIDICDGSINGATVRAAVGGTVTSIWLCSNNHYGTSDPTPSCCSGNGHGLVIYGDDGRYYNYAHMQAGSIPTDRVNYGTRVEAGQTIGRVGSTGNSSGPHLHFQISTSSSWWIYGIVDPQNESYNYSQSSDISFTPVDMGADFYAYIINTAFWKKLVNDGNHNACFSDTSDVVKTIWHFIRNSNGSYKIISAYDGQALDCDLGNSANRTNIGVWDASNVNFQEWFVYGESGSYYLRPNCSEGVLDMAGGSFYEGVNAQIFEKNDSDAQKYQIWKINHEDVPIKLKNDFYARIINTHEWKALANDGNHHALFNDTLPENQKIWHFIRKENGSYKIQSVYDGKVLDVDLGQSASGTDVGIWDDADTINQEWYIYGESSKYYFSPRCSDCVLDLSGGNYYDGVNAQIYTRYFTNGQLFQIWELEKPNLIAPSITVKSGSQSFYKTEFSWNGCDDATGYDLRIYDISGENELYLFKNIQATSYLATLPAGNYIAEVTALNNLFCFSSRGQGYQFSVKLAYCLGDSDGDGKVTAVDATRIMLDIARLDPGVDHDTLMNGDVNGNGCLDIIDATYIQRYLSKIDTPYTIGETIG